MNWKHCYLRKATQEEGENFSHDDIWGGEIPSEDGKILVYKDGFYSIDDWVYDLDAAGLSENYDYTDFHWCELEEPETENEG
ncbi:TPA: hypothetical protein ACQ0F8_001979 [Streptococcus agalactiae]|nr:hypothetical protein [Streptococcus agalactiae]